MGNREPRIDDLAAAVLDGTSVDWASVESGSAADPLVRQLRIVESLASFHRDLPTVDPSRAWLPAALSPAPPEHWGPLRLLERVGQGSFGEVFRAWDTRLDREVALKLLAPANSSQRQEASTIIQEGRLLARVRHANVVTIHGAEQIDGQVGLWMEFVRGHTLEQLLQQGHVFSAEELVDVGIELCRAVSAVHSAGLLHRDIKASNVTRAEDGRVVLMDFGTGIELEDRASCDLAGTPLYLAPEVLRGGAPTASSDLYSLGVLLHHLATNSYPVHGPTVGDLRRAHERGERVSIRAARPDLRPALAAVLARAVGPLPERRYQSAEALALDLVALKRSPRIWSRMARWSVAAAMGLVVAGLGWTALQRDEPPAAPAVEVTADRPTIAVLPFENLSSEPDSEDFTNGLTDEILRHLAAIDGLETRSSASSFRFRNAPRELAGIGSELGVRFVLEGSVSRFGQRLRVNARLVGVPTAVTLWANSFERTIDDVIAIQDEISLAIVNQMRLKLGSGQRLYTPSPNAYYLFLLGRGLQVRRQPEASRKAADLFAEVVALDPGYAPAWAALASAATQASLRGPGADLPTPDPRMKEAALKAIGLDPLLADAHAALGSLYAYDRQWALADASFAKALELNPSLTTTHADFALTSLLPRGRFQDAVRLLEQARVADPLSLDIRRLLALAQVDNGQFDDAIANCQWVLQRDPAFPYVKLWLGRALLFAGRPDEALEAFRPGGGPYLGYLYGVTGRREEAEAVAARLAHAPSQMLVYAGLGDQERTFEALARAEPTDWYRTAMYLHRREMAALHGTPRLEQVRRALGLID